MSGYDLHLHSTFSDGLFTPAELISRALLLGLEGIAITDHDSVSAVEAALVAATGTTLDVVPGLELSTVGECGALHILGYCIDHTDPTLCDRLSGLRAARLERAERIVDALRSDGVAITIDAVLALSGGGAVGRAHIARVLVEGGHACTTADAFNRYVGDSAPYFVEKRALTAAEAITWVHDAGGAAVLAHPALSNAHDAIARLVSDGLDGLEAFHAAHTPDDAIGLESRARELGLLVTGGSDFHGAFREGGDMGSATCTADAVHALRARAYTRRERA